MKNQWSRRIFLKWKKMLCVRVKKAPNTSFSASPKAPRFSRRRKRETRVTGDKAQRSIRKKRGEISPVFSFPPNLVPRVLSYPSLRSERGTGRREPWERGCFPPSFARKFSSRERRLGTRQLLSPVGSCIAWLNRPWGPATTTKATRTSKKHQVKRDYVFAKIKVQFCYLWLYSGTETISHRLLLRMRWQGWTHGMKLKKVRPTFSSFNAMPVKITKQLIIMVGAPWSNLFDIFFITDSTGAFCVWVKALSYDFSEKWTLNNNILVT